MSNVAHQCFPVILVNISAQKFNGYPQVQLHTAIIDFYQSFFSELTITRSLLTLFLLPIYLWLLKWILIRHMALPRAAQLSEQKFFCKPRKAVMVG